MLLGAWCWVLGCSRLNDGEDKQEGGEGGGGAHFKAWAMAAIKQDSESDGAMRV